MRLALFDDFIPGVVNGDRVVDVSSAVGQIRALPVRDRMPQIITDFERLRPALEAASRGEGKPLGSVRLRAPIPRPTKLICAIGNYMEGLGEVLRPIDMFLKSPTAIIGPGDTVVLPKAQADIFHHEAELAVVIGTPAASVTPERAMDSVFGYACFIDVSARGLGGGVGFGDKSFDTFGPLGPWIVTKDEIPDPHHLHVQLWVNGELRHDYNTGDMEHHIPDFLAWTSSVSALEPGDVLACGTNHQGVGSVQNGDTIEIEIERIGRMAVKVSDPLKRSWPRGVDQRMADRILEARKQAIAARMRGATA